MTSRKSSSDIRKLFDCPSESFNENTLHEYQMQLMDKQELRLRYIQLMNDAQKMIGRKEAIQLFKESELIWEKLSN